MAHGRTRGKQRQGQPAAAANKAKAPADPVILYTEGGKPFRQSQLVPLYNEVQDLWQEARQVMQETDFTGMRALAEEEVGWNRLGLSGSSLLDPLGDRTRRIKVEQSRTQSELDPLAVHALRLYRVFTIGRGVDIQVDEKHDNNEAIKKAVDAFWDAPENRSVFGYLGLLENTNRWNRDGELIVVMVKSPGSPTKVRRVDPLQITKIVYSAEDVGTVQGYLREFTGKNNKPMKWFYWDALLPEDQREDRDGESIIPEGFEERDDTIYFAPYGRRGVPLLTPSLAWGKAHKAFMTARTAIQQSLARFAWKNKIKGGEAAVSAAVTQDASGFQTGDREDNPAAEAGSIRVENENSTTTPFKVETGAPAAQVDGNMIILMFGAGVGIMPHWFGAGSEAKFSTSTQMELPMLKTMQEGREVQVSIYLDLIGIDLTNQGLEDGRGAVVPEFRDPITIKDIPALIEAMTKAIQADPRFLVAPQVAKFMLSTLGIADVDEVLKLMEEVPVAPPGAAGNRQESLRRVVEGLRAITESAKGANGG